jgi:glutamate racemase
LAEEAVLHTKNNRIAIIGTRRTVESQAYVRELKDLQPDVTVLQQACPLLVPLVEEGWTDTPETTRIVRSYLRNLKTQNPDTLVLGCTHYEALHPLFKRLMGRRCTVIHSPVIVAEKLKAYLARHTEYDQAIERSGNLTFLTTGDPVRFRDAGERFFGKTLPNVQQVRIPALSLAKGEGDS